MTTAEINTSPEFFQVANGGPLKEYWTQEFLVAELDTYEDGTNIDHYYFTFQVKEYYTDDEDMFGHPITSYMLICQRRYFSSIRQDYEDECEVGLGEEFANAEYAKEFAINYVIPSFRRHLHFGGCPVVILDPQY